VCESLEEAHAAGLVHRDIKPANIHLGTLGLLRDFVKVLDFGLVKSLGEPDTPLLATAPGFTVGTPAYMAPEMALGETVDGRADIYALGCVAYFLLSGQLVFEGVEAVQVLIKRLNEDPPRVSERTELPIPRELEQVVMACLSRNPNARPSAGELSRSLGAVPVRPWTQTDAGGWWQVNQA
jgi:serine/threonine-protein kinase